MTGFYAEGGIDKGSMVTESMFGKLGAKNADAVFLSVDMEALDQSVAGTLRAGDRIDIYTVKKEQDKDVEVTEVLSSVTIERSYTGNGLSIQKEDTACIAQYITNRYKHGLFTGGTHPFLLQKGKDGKLHQGKQKRF